MLNGDPKQKLSVLIKWLVHLVFWVFIFEMNPNFSPKKLYDTLDFGKVKELRQPSKPNALSQNKDSLSKQAQYRYHVSREETYTTLRN